MDIQSFIDGFLAAQALERSKAQVTLGRMIEFLKTSDPELLLPRLENPHSYRGYYSDLAFERSDGFRKASEILSDCLSALGKTFEGWKGGDFLMSEDTPLWIATEGCCGQKIVEINPDGTFATAEDE